MTREETSGERSVLDRPLELADVPSGGRPVSITANDQECAAIARRLGILGVDRLALTGHASRGPNQSVILEALLEAHARQACVVTLEPVEETISEQLYIRLVEAGRAQESDPTVENEDEDVEEAESGIVNLGELAVQYLSLALDTYPRAEGAETVILPGSEDPEPVKESPFDVLRKLKDNA